MSCVPDHNVEDEEEPPAFPLQNGFNLKEVSHTESVTSSVVNMRTAAASMVLDLDSQDLEAQGQSTRMHTPRMLEEAENDEGSSKSILFDISSNNDIDQTISTDDSTPNIKNLSLRWSQSSKDDAERSPATPLVKSQVEIILPKRNRKQRGSAVVGKESRGAVSSKPALERNTTEQNAAYPPSLQAGQRVLAVPGAQRIQGQRVQRVASIDIWGDDSITTPTAPQSAREYLIHAEVVQSQSSLRMPIVEAKPIEDDPNDSNHPNDTGRKSYRLKLAIVVLVLAVVGLTVWLVFGRDTGSQSSDNSNETGSIIIGFSPAFISPVVMLPSTPTAFEPSWFKPSEPTAPFSRSRQPTNSPTIPSTAPPTIGRTDTMTAVPSARPFSISSPTIAPIPTTSNTTLFADSLPGLLNKRSVDALMDPNSAQSKAVVWLEARSDVHDQLSDIRLLQRFVLASIYYSTGDQQWSRTDSWLTNVHECDWFSTSDEESCVNGEYVNLDLVGNGLEGVIPDELALLSMLQRVDLGSNMLGGLLLESPMDNLFELHIDDNSLDDTVLTSLLALSNLKVLDISSNGLAAPFPSHIVSMMNLVAFDFSANYFSGSIPTEIGRLKLLERLSCNRNPIMGSTNVFQFEEGYLTGRLPTELGSLTLLKYLDVGYNELEGSIPSQISSLSHLEVLVLHNNWLTGSIPSIIGTMTKLQQLLIYQNFIVGTIPTHVGLLNDLVFFDAQFNLLTGSLPSEFSQILSLKSLSLTGNEITGSIPNTLGLLENIVDLQLGSANFTSSIPSELGQLTNLEFLLLNENHLSGTLPTELGNLINLSTLTVDSNILTGPIPSELGRLVNLDHLTLYNNDVQGTVSTEVCTSNDISFFLVDCLSVVCGCCDSTFGLPC